MIIVSKVNDKKVVHVGQTKNICLVCGVEVPEGREICPACEKK